MNIRHFKPSDVNQIAQLFHETIRTVNLGDYTEEQVRAWAPNDIHFRDWLTKCSEKQTFVAEEAGVITGFAQLENDGYFDCFYCHKDFQGRGVGRLLYQKIEKEAKIQNSSKLTVEASITAKPFFEKMGFSVLAKQAVSVRGVELMNFRMEKTISDK